MSPIIGSFASGSGFGGKGGKKGFSGLYDFDSVQFDTPSNYYNGPTTAEIRSSATSPTGGDMTWVNDTSYLTTSSGIIYWTVPATGTYQITAWGAQGNPGHTSNNGVVGCWGSRMRGDFNLTEGETIRILVGQYPNVTAIGGGGNYAGGGGGGTYVTRSPHANESAILLIAGGGGGGAHSYGPGGNAPATSSNGSLSANSSNGPAPQSQPGGTGGNGGPAGNQHGGSGGGGFYGNGPNGPSYAGYGGLSYINGGRGGYGSTGYLGTPNGYEYGYGGFGGGSGCDHGGGAGGGYSGGGGGNHFYSGGGGGGSVNNGANQSNHEGASGTNTLGRPASKSGRVLIQWLG
jgi:hypothetical protein